MESSGDGFHYFAYVKAGSPTPAEPKSGTQKPETPKPASGRKKLAEPIHPAGTASDDEPVSLHELPGLTSIACPSCSHLNSRERRFCSSCSEPLYRKCAGCGALIDTISNDCPRCGNDLEQAAMQAVETFKGKLKRFDILENSGDIWLKAAGIELDDGEQAVAIFPRGNMMMQGPVVESGAAGESARREHADVVLTDKRIVISFAGETVSSLLLRIDTCLVSNSGRFFSDKYMLILGFDGAVYRVFLPFSGRKAKTALDTIASFIHLEMLA